MIITFELTWVSGEGRGGSLLQRGCINYPHHSETTAPAPDDRQTQNEEEKKQGQPQRRELSVSWAPSLIRAQGVVGKVAAQPRRAGAAPVCASLREQHTTSPQRRTFRQHRSPPNL